MRFKPARHGEGDSSETGNVKSQVPSARTISFVVNSLEVILLPRTDSFQMSQIETVSLVIFVTYRQAMSGFMAWERDRVPKLDP
jgi:hypothetical protein